MLHGFVVNKALFEKYNIPLPTDYKSFVSACQAFEKVGIRGFAADYFYDYTCMETLQGLSCLRTFLYGWTQVENTYSDPASTEKVGLDNVVWQLLLTEWNNLLKIQNLNRIDINLDYDMVDNLYQNGELAMYFGSSFGVKKYKDQGIDTVFLPFFEQNGEKWIMTTPYFQVALNSELEKDETRRDNAMKDS